MLPPNENTVNIKQPPARKSYHHGDLRGALIDAGMHRLETHPRDELGLRELARDLGVSASAVYRHFPDKAALLRAIADRGFAIMGEMQQSAAKEAPPGREFAATGAAYVRFARRHPAVFRLMFTSAPPCDLLSLPLSEISGPMRLLREHANALTPPGSPEPVRKIVAMRAWALVHGLAVLALDRMITVDDGLIDAVIGNPGSYVGDLGIPTAE
jgi:AcrR family transcriptional regulator